MAQTDGILLRPPYAELAPRLRCSVLNLYKHHDSWHQNVSTKNLKRTCLPNFSLPPRVKVGHLSPITALTAVTHSHVLSDICLHWCHTGSKYTMLFCMDLHQQESVPLLNRLDAEPLAPRLCLSWKCKSLARRKLLPSAIAAVPLFSNPGLHLLLQLCQKHTWCRCDCAVTATVVLDTVLPHPPPQ